MKKIISSLYTLIIAVFLLTPNANAQVSMLLNPSASNVSSGDAVSVILKVNNFTDVAGMQFSMEWDPSVLQYSGVGNFNLPDLSTASFGTNNTANGKLTNAWFDNTTQGMTLANNTEIITVFFTAVGLPGSSTDIELSSSPTMQKLYDSGINPMSFFNQATTVSILPCTPSISGNIKRGNGTEVEGVDVLLNGVPTGNETTNNIGNYAFCGLTDGNNYTVTPSKDGNDLDCVTTADLIKLQRHILGLEPFQTPYQFISADVNGSQSLTTFDAVQMRKLILGIDTEWPSLDTWIFVRADYIFPNPNNPWDINFPPYPATADISPLNGDTQVDFIAVKTGDVTDCSEVYSAPVVTFSAPDMTVCGGQLIMDITVDGFVNVVGLQFSMQWDIAGLQFNSLQGFNLPSLTNANFGMTNINTGKLTCSWFDNTTNGIARANGETIFQIVFDVIVAPGNFYPVSFVQNPTIFESVDNAGNVYGLAVDNGSVTVDPDMTNCVVNLNVSSNPVSCMYRSTGDLTAENVTVENGASVEFTSDSGILLENGFAVEFGAEFEANIQSCSPD